MPLTNPRFAGDPVLEACAAGQHRMLAPEAGPAVAKVQQALIDLGFSLPLHGADGSFNDETGDAVTAYKTSRGIFPNDPVVGPGTMAGLDSEPALRTSTPVQARLAKAEAMVSDMQRQLRELSALLAEVRADLP